MVVAGGAIGEQSELRFLDAVLHLPAGAVECIVERRPRGLEVGDDVAGIVALIGVFGLRNHPSLGAPVLRA